MVPLLPPVKDLLPAPTAAQVPLGPPSETALPNLSPELMPAGCRFCVSRQPKLLAAVSSRVKMVTMPLVTPGVAAAATVQVGPKDSDTPSCTMPRKLEVKLPLFCQPAIALVRLKNQMVPVIG